jgi:ribulose 1,5-bisphosphate synthetase/thiazole synthase
MLFPPLIRDFALVEKRVLFRNVVFSEDGRGMDDWLDDTAYDVIIVGTGLTETVAAAALARSGRKVLHLDALPFYGEVFGVTEWSEKE